MNTLLPMQTEARTWTAPNIAPLDDTVTAELQTRIDQKTKPLGALGRLEEIALRVGRIQGTAFPRFRSPTILVFAGDHGLCPSARTRAAGDRCGRGGRAAGSSQSSETQGAPGNR